MNSYIYTPKTVIENSTEYFLTNPTAIEWCNNMHYLFNMQEIRNIIGLVLLFLGLYMFMHKYNYLFDFDGKEEFYYNKVKDGFLLMAFLTLLGYGIYLVV